MGVIAWGHEPPPAGLEPCSQPTLALPPHTHPSSSRDTAQLCPGVGEGEGCLPPSAGGEATGQQRGHPVRTSQTGSGLGQTQPCVSSTGPWLTEGCPETSLWTGLWTTALWPPCQHHFRHCWKPSSGDLSPVSREDRAADQNFQPAWLGQRPHLAPPLGLWF